MTECAQQLAGIYGAVVATNRARAELEPWLAKVLLGVIGNAVSLPATKEESLKHMLAFALNSLHFREAVAANTSELSALQEAAQASCTARQLLYCLCGSVVGWPQLHQSGWVKQEIDRLESSGVGECGRALDQQVQAGFR